MAEWRLFPEGTVPEFTTPGFFTAHPWIDPVHQRGHAERIALAVAVITEVVANHPVRDLVDLGCGDGSLLAAVKGLGVPSWGYDLGVDNIRVARERGVDARHGDFTSGVVEYGDLVVATEVVEHMVDPHDWLRQIPGRYLVVSSPYDEDDGNHYEHHAWAWDQAGYRTLVEGAGWRVEDHVDCPAGFQAIAASREVTSG